MTQPIRYAAQTLSKSNPVQVAAPSVQTVPHTDQMRLYVGERDRLSDMECQMGSAVNDSW